MAPILLNYLVTVSNTDCFFKIPHSKILKHANCMSLLGIITQQQHSAAALSSSTQLLQQQSWTHCHKVNISSDLYALISCDFSSCCFSYTCTYKGNMTTSFVFFFFSIKTEASCSIFSFEAFSGSFAWILVYFSFFPCAQLGVF